MVKNGLLAHHSSIVPNTYKKAWNARTFYFGKPSFDVALNRRFHLLICQKLLLTTCSDQPDQHQREQLKSKLFYRMQNWNIGDGLKIRNCLTCCRCNKKRKRPTAKSQTLSCKTDSEMGQNYSIAIDYFFLHFFFLFLLRFLLRTKNHLHWCQSCINGWTWFLLWCRLPEIFTVLFGD